jgi:HlyD family secretion protein
LAVPNDAVRNVREGVAIAVQLGLNPDTVQADVQRQMSESFGGAGGNGMTGMGGGMNGRPSGAGGGTTARESRGEVALATSPQQGQQFQMPEVSEQDCANVRSAFAKHPDAQGKLQALFQKVRAGEVDMQQMRTSSDSIYKALGVDGRVARACQMRERGQRSEVKGQSDRAGSNAAGTQRGPQSSATPNAQRQRGAAAQSGSAPVPAGEFSSVRSRARPALVFISDSGVYKPRVIRVGAANLDYTEVISGLNEGDRVALLSVAQAAAARELANERMRTMTGTGMPGSVPGGTSPGGPPRR